MSAPQLLLDAKANLGEGPLWSARRIVDCSADSFTEANGMLTLHIAGGTNILVYPKPNHTPATFTILNFPVREIEAAVARLKERDVRFEQYDLPGLATDEKGIFRGGFARTQLNSSPAQLKTSWPRPGSGLPPVSRTVRVC